MAEDDRAVAEGSASWGLEGRMGLHLRGRGLQLSPYEESGDARDVSRGRCGLAGPKMNPLDANRCRQKPFPNHKITGTGENLSHGVPFSASCEGPRSSHFLWSPTAGVNCEELKAFLSE